MVNAVSFEGTNVMNHRHLHLWVSIYSFDEKENSMKKELNQQYKFKNLRSLRSLGRANSTRSF